MATLKDPVFGILVDDGDDWNRDYEISIFGEDKLVKLVIRADEKPTTKQRKTFAKFESSKDACTSEIEKALFDHYEAIVEDRRGDLDDLADEMMPVISKSSELKAMVLLKEIILQDWDAPDDKEIGFLFDCTWAPDEGLGVKLSDNKVTEIGGQDIVL
jgi:hypothetical protein